MSSEALTSATPAGAPAGAGASAGAQSARLVETLLRARELSLLLIVALVVLLTAIAQPRFVSSQSLRDISLNVAIVALLAIGQTVVVVSRNIDLSVGSVLGLSAFATSLLFADHPGIAIPLAVLYGIAIGAGVGVLNGALVTLGRVPSLVVTLGTLYIVRGADYAWGNGREVDASQLPDAFLKLGSDAVAGIPILPLITLLVLLVVGYAMRSFRAGRELYAIGSNPDAATLAGIRVGRRVLGAFVVSGALAGLAGVLYSARFGTVDSAAGTGFELTVVTAVVVGGVAIFGGAGSVYGAALGALLLGVIGSALVILKVNPFWEQAIDGALLLSAIALDRILALRVERVLQRRSGRHGS
jgi:rhamnose transport system permease protein